jgi:hypothetical protein
MKNVLILIALVLPARLLAQGLIGTWQQTGNKTCFDSPFKESDTEKELTPSMGATRNAIAKMVVFDEKGRAEESIASQGKRKASSKNEFRYQISDNELQYLDKKSGMITSRFIIDELTETTLRFHNAMRDCEIQIYTRVK